MISPYLVAIVIGWLVAQGLKYVFDAIRSRTWSHLRQLYLSGSMPSAHSATVVSLATVVGLRDGLDSAIFAVALLFAGVVMYDAMMVRRSSGEQGLAIQSLIKEAKSKVLLPRSARGHTPVEVLAGAILGVIVGSVVFVTTI